MMRQTYSPLRSIFKLGAFLFTLASAIAQPGSYYNSISDSSPTFVTDLHALINPHTRITYDQFDETNVASFASRDTTGGQKVVTCVYSGENYVYFTPFAWGHFSREHTWCQSWMPSGAPTSSPEYSDQHHLFPTEQNHANGIRSNHPEGIVVSPTSTYLQCKLGTDANGNTVFEPRASHKGDFARALFYMSVCYNGANGYDWTFNHLNTVTLPGLSEAPQDVNLLLQWSKDDPPDAWEVSRNNYIQSIQENRNPFVDHPEWVNYINFNDLSKLSPIYSTEPTNQPTGISITGITSSTLTVNWTNAATGSQPPSGYLLELYHSDDYFTPADGSNYADDTDLSDGRGVVNVTNAGGTSYQFTGLICGTTYYVHMYSYNGSGAAINYKIDGTILTGNATTGSSSSATEPSKYSGGFSTQTPTIASSSITVRWSDSTGGTLPTGYIIMANTTNTFADPVDGVVYPDDTFLSDGSAVINVAYGGPDSLQFTGLLSATTYAFKIYPYNGDGCQRNYRTGNFPILTNNIEYTTTGSSPSSLSVVVNEYMNGSVQSSEWVELLVLEDNLDMRGMVLRDYSTSGSTQAGLTFSNASLWSPVSAGSFIVILAATNTQAEDLSFSGDKLVIVKATNTTYFSGTSFNIGGSADGVEILSFGSTHIHSLSHGSKPGNLASLSVPTANITGSSTSGNVARFVNIAASSDFGLDANTQHSSSATQGAANDAAEVTFIANQLPVELSSFAVHTAGRSIVLNWTTSTEVNNYGFEIERRTPTQSSPLQIYDPVGGEGKGGSQWQRLGFVEGHGTTNARHNYSYIDNAVSSGKFSYRLKQIDRDGKFSYSKEVEETLGLTPDEYSLSQNYPNPFNPATTIRFAVRSPQRVTLKVYDLLGREVRTLFNGEAKVNELYAISFERAGLSGGVYYYRLSTEDRTELRKMVMIK